MEVWLDLTASRVINRGDKSRDFRGGSPREYFFRCHPIFFKNFKIDILSQLEIWPDPVETKKFYRFFDLRTKKNYRFLKKIDVCP